MIPYGSLGAPAPFPGKVDKFIWGQYLVGNAANYSKIGVANPTGSGKLIQIDWLHIRNETGGSTRFMLYNDISSRYALSQVGGFRDGRRGRQWGGIFVDEWQLALNGAVLSEFRLEDAGWIWIPIDYTLDEGRALYTSPVAVNQTNNNVWLGSVWPAP